jgi:hypothetical protein
MVVETFLPRLNHRTTEDNREHIYSFGELLLSRHAGSTVPVSSASGRRRSQNDPRLMSTERKVWRTSWTAESNKVNEHRRWSLGRSISTSSHFSLRILAANLVREISLADIDVSLFWSSDLLERKEPRLPSSFLADHQWLRDTALYLSNIDDHWASPDKRYAFLVHDRRILICTAEKRLTRSCL